MRGLHNALIGMIKAIKDKLGSTDISSIGDGTVTGAISTMNTRHTATLTLPTGQYSGVSTNTVVEKNGVLSFEFSATLSGTLAGSNGLLATLPVGYRPSMTRAISLRGSYGTLGNNEYSAVIYNDGRIVTATGGSTFSGSVRIISALVL